MTSLVIHGGRRLNGEVTPSANKNAILPILCASLLTREAIRIANVPDITDVRKVLAFFRALGSKVAFTPASGRLEIRHGPPDRPRPVGLPGGMRSSIMLVPGLLQRYGRVILDDDVKGCSLGSREVDSHIAVFEAFGARVEAHGNSMEIVAPAPFRPTDYWADFASVTTTENFLMCGACARGRSELTNAASEPHVQELSAFLARIGVTLEGQGTSRVAVSGPPAFGGADIVLEDDHHEVATFMALGAITGGEVRVRNSNPGNFPLLDRTFGKFGIRVTHADGWSMARAGAHTDRRLRVTESFTQYVLPRIEGAPWPYVPVDLLPIFVALGVCAEGSMMFWNKVYDGALGWTGELSKFGAHTLLCDPHRLVTFGGKPLVPATVESPFIIRVAVALLMVAATIDGRSKIRNATPIRRAHPHFVEKLTALGAEVEWLPAD